MRFAAAFVLFALLGAAAVAESPTKGPVAAAMAEGNWDDALRLARLRLDSGDGGADDLRHAAACLGRLNRIDELDGLLESAATRYAQDPRVLLAAAEAYQDGPEYGSRVAGEFRRGPSRGAAAMVSVEEADRVRALRLAVEAHRVATDNPTKADAADALADLALWGRSDSQAWRLQRLTSLDGDLPPDDDHWGEAPSSDPPANAAGDGPLLYEAPATWDAAKTDGERFRWALAEVARRDPARLPPAELRYAEFLYEQLGVHTLLRDDWFTPEDPDTPSPETSALAVESLTDSESIARLATGVKRFTLPEGHRFLETFRKHEQWQRLFDAYLNRNQRPSAVEAARKWLAAESDADVRDAIQQSLDQLTKPWVRFDAAPTQPAGAGAKLRVTHRNAEGVAFTARKVDVAKLLADVREELARPAGPENWRHRDVENLGWRLLNEDGDKYLGEAADAWKLDLDRRADHGDGSASVATPLQRAGAYLVTATPQGADGTAGAEVSVVLWVADSVLVRKATVGGALYQVLDAVDGRPIAGATVDLFGYRYEHDGGQRPRVRTSRVAERTDADGLAALDIAPPDGEPGYEWLAVATTDDGRLAHLGFSGIWRSHRDDDAPDHPRAYVVTDRPVYRPGDTVELKAWVGKPDYATAATEADAAPSPYAHQEFQVEVYDPRGDRVDSRRVTADLYGGIAGDYETAEGAPLGAYRVDVVGFGGGTFRVEEYRKPEFEVVVDAPQEPTKLGDTFEAVVRADYYAGTPVRGGRVAYTVTRTRRSGHWLPPRPWDWLYGVGYGWLGQDAPWRSDWRVWGCEAPLPPWWPGHAGPPEVVAQGEAELDAAGELRLPIDTAPALARQPGSDHEYEIEAEVTDAGRRTIVGAGSVLAARRPVEVTVWLGRGFYEVGDTVVANVGVHRPDGKPLAAGGELRLLKIDPTDPDDAARLVEPKERLVQSWALPSDREGSALVRVKASEPGRYRVAYRCDASDPGVEGGAVFTIRGPGFADGDFRYGALELVPDKAEYAPGDTARLLVNTDRRDAVVTLYLRPVSGTYERPRVLRLGGKSAVVELPIAAADAPNFFVEAHTVADGRLHAVTRRVAVPPAPRVLKVEASPSETTYAPGDEGTLRVRVTDATGAPVVGQLAIAVYDRSVEAIAGGPAGGDIRAFFWQWTREHWPAVAHNLERTEDPVTRRDDPLMESLGVFGDVAFDDEPFGGPVRRGAARDKALLGGGAGLALMTMAADAAPAALAAEANGAAANGAEAAPAVAVRADFADTAVWIAAVETDADGLAEVAMPLPESLTSWKVRVWGVSSGARVGQGEADVVTRKDLMVRLRAPRLLVERDEAVVSALVQNESSRDLSVKVRLGVEGDGLRAADSPEKTVAVPAGGEALVDWRVSARAAGDALLTATAVAEGEAPLSDGMRVELPVLVHGAEIVQSFSGVIAPQENATRFELAVPAERIPERTRLEVRYSPTLVGAMLDTLPYLIEYPHGCTEQTLNRFLPAAIVRHTIERLGVDLADLRLAEPVEGPPGRSEPVFDRAELDRITRAGVTRLAEMQLSDGGWGWFSGWGEHSSPHTTAVVVRGLGVARASGVAVPQDMLDRGTAWLVAHRAAQLALLAAGDKRDPQADDRRRWKGHADDLDALVELTLGELGQPHDGMLRRLFADRQTLAPYSLATLGLALDLRGGDKNLALRDRVIRNLKQFVETDDENQTAWLNLPGGGWWCWYGSEFEAHAYFLRLLSATEPKGDLAPRLVKYLLANRLDGTRWHSTRDTALVVEAMAAYVAASGEAAVDGTVQVWLDGKLRDTRSFDAKTALRFDGRFTLAGQDLPTGRHTLELRRTGAGRLYAGASLANFSLEDDLRAAGLEVRVSRRVFRLEAITAQGEDVDANGGVLTPQVERFRRVEVPNLGAVASGDLVEVELTIASKNDCEYLVIEDPKPAGFEPVEARSGYGGNELGAYVEYRDAEVRYYVQNLARGERTVTHRLRAETPGRYSALPTQIRAMYAPDLRGNSDEVKVVVE